MTGESASPAAVVVILTWVDNCYFIHGNDKQVLLKEILKHAIRMLLSYQK
jgi:hypothetical protein